MERFHAQRAKRDEWCGRIKHRKHMVSYFWQIQPSTGGKRSYIDGSIKEGHAITWLPRLSHPAGLVLHQPSKDGIRSEQPSRFDKTRFVFYCSSLSNVETSASGACLPGLSTMSTIPITSSTSCKAIIPITTKT